MASAQPGEVAAGPLPRLRQRQQRRVRLRSSIAFWHPVYRACLASLTLLGRLACKPEGRGGRRFGGDRDRGTCNIRKGGRTMSRIKDAFKQARQARARYECERAELRNPITLPKSAGEVH